MFPPEVGQGDSVFLFKVSYCKQEPFSWSGSCHVLLTCVLSVGDFAVYNDPPSLCSAEVLASVPKPERAVTCLTEAIHVLDAFVQP